MSYVDSILEPGEQVVYRTTLSWTVFGQAIGLAIAALLALVVAIHFYGLGIEAAALALVAILAVLAFASFARAWFRRATTEIAVTDRRIILKRGFIRRHTVEMNMQKVE